MTITSYDELYAALMANLPPAIISTLLSRGVDVVGPASANTIYIYRDTTISIILTNLGDVTGYTKVWFTVKEDLDDNDEEAVIQIDTTTGLLRIDGEEPAAAANGSLVFSDEEAGDCTVTIKPAEAQGLRIYNAYPVFWDVKMLLGGEIYLLQSGEMYIHGTPTRDIT